MNKKIATLLFALAVPLISVYPHVLKAHDTDPGSISCQSGPQPYSSYVLLGNDSVTVNSSNVTPVSEDLGGDDGCATNDGTWFLSGQPDFDYIINGSPDRFWIHDSNGIQNCLAPNNIYFLTGLDRDQIEVQETDTTATCSLTSSDITAGTCSGLADIAIQEMSPSFEFTCTTPGNTNTLNGLFPILFHLNYSGDRVWFHQYAGGGSGSATCYDSIGLYQTTGWQHDPGDIQDSTNSNNC